MKRIIHSAVAIMILGFLILSVARVSVASDTPETRGARKRMVATEIIAAGVKDPRVIQAMESTPRHEFVSVANRKYAYLDMALPIGHQQTISSPFIVAYMTEQLQPKPTDRVLEIGTGSGYQAAVLSPLVREVYSIEIVEPLGRQAAKTLKRLGYKNIFTKVGDGYQGWAEHAPFDKIIVTCSPERVPRALAEQLAEGGQIIIPVGERFQQTLYRLTKRNGKMEPEKLQATLFVPMTGAAEDQRQVQPDPANPALVNGDFEELMELKPKDGSAEKSDAQKPTSKKPSGWHYLRQIEIVEKPLEAPSGNCYARFLNKTPGRACQALQGFAVDGRKVRRLQVSLSVKGHDIRPGQNAQELPVLAITFYDKNRNILGQKVIGPWRGSFDWYNQTSLVDVPIQAREAFIRIGLFGAVGDLWVDNLEIERAK